MNQENRCQEIINLVQAELSSYVFSNLNTSHDKIDSKKLLNLFFVEETQELLSKANLEIVKEIKNHEQVEKISHLIAEKILSSLEKATKQFNMNDINSNLEDIITYSIKIALSKEL